MIATEKGLRRTVRKAQFLHSVYMLYRRFGLDYQAWATKRSRDEAMAEARAGKRRISEAGAK